MVNAASSHSNEYDVVVVGGGPCGFFAACTMAEAGLSVLILEARSDIRHQGGASHIHAEITADLARFGGKPLQRYVYEEVLPAKTYCVYKANARRWNFDDRLFRVDTLAESPMGVPSEVLIYQGRLNEALKERAEEVGVEMLFDAEVTEARVDGVTYVRGGESHRVSCSYLVGADGAKSIVRKQLFEERGVEFEVYDDTRYPRKCYVVCDVKGTPSGLAKYDYPEKTGFVECQDWSWRFERTKRHICYFALPGNIMRFGYFLEDGETFEEMSTEDGVDRILSKQGLNKDDYEIDRIGPYWLRHKVIKRGSLDDRVFLLGDAAQVMGPFLSQGMCHGLRAALNLAWKLALVEKFHVKKSPLLSTYEADVQPHAKKVVMASQQNMFTVSSQSLFFRFFRDIFLFMLFKFVIFKDFFKRALYLPLMYGTIPPPEKVQNIPGKQLLSRNFKSNAVGTVFIQPHVDDHQLLFASVPLHSIMLVTFDRAFAVGDLSQSATQHLKAIDATYLPILTGPHTDNNKAARSTETGRFLKELPRNEVYMLPMWRAEYGNPDLVIVRPDKFVFAAVKMKDAQAAIDELLTFFPIK